MDKPTPRPAELQVYLLSLGCAKNQVDSEIMSGALRRDGFTLTEDAAAADIIIINTCGFIESAKQESIEAILTLAAYKQQGRCRALAVVGCMAEKYAAEMLESMPEIDIIAGVGRYEQIGRLLAESVGLDYRPAEQPPDPYLLRELPPAAASAYVKIAEGCDNRCSYCLIPQLRGPYRSRPEADILAETARLAERGVKEVILIAQDVTRYGLDLCGEPRLAALLAAVAAQPFAMVRLLYAYPDLLDAATIRVMAERDNICHYLDLPVQHGVDRILRAMNRRGGGADILRKLSELRTAMPDIMLRSTVMVGFPGETEEDFAALLEFLEQARFDWLGAFPYYREQDTPAAGFTPQIADEIKQRRLDAVMRQAARITARRLSAFRGETLTVLAEGPATELGPGWYQGRSQYQAPEVDGMVYFRAAVAPEAGELCRVRITDSDIYDLIGEML